MGRVGIRHICAVTLGVVLLTGCWPWVGEQAKQVVPDTNAEAARRIADHKANIALAAKVKANELGKIPVLMYHRVVRNATGPDDRTPAEFRAELERLAKEGYVPITAKEYVTGQIKIPAGKHPVVLTFDDASPSQVALDGTGVPLPNTAIGILYDVARRHPGFRPVATFFLTRDVFGKHDQASRRQVLMWLVENGFDLGNHTRDHINLLGLPKKKVYEQIVAGHKMITDLAGVEPHTLALPYGNQPNEPKWARSGTADGVTYTYGGVFRAGYAPAPSPFSQDFDPLAIPRIRSHGKKGECARFCSEAWLDWFEKHPEERYTSDGNIKTVAYPRFQSPFAAKRYKELALPY
ncbi:Polysaccharide deacetylase [Thermostaphylospora chromogena]|uniref:Polysaccharide deacetylase n=1 Tax=Thermostaphylospora chromogena TaxID=35622 RepID=A0A1H1DT06_9ACTN|nr:Polysaccharide deacetylase [Thermostaphylospora chromogena]